MAEGTAQLNPEGESSTPEQHQRAELAIAEIRSDLGDSKIMGDALANRAKLVKEPILDESQKTELEKLNEELKNFFGHETLNVLSEWEKAEGTRVAAKELEK